MKRKRTLADLPRIAGGQDPDEVLATIAGDLKSLKEREENGEDVKSERDALLAEKAAAEAEKAEAADEQPEETEIERLRRFEREQREKSQAASIASEIVTRIKTEQVEEQERLTKSVQAEVARQLGDGGVDLAVQSAIKSTRRASRFDPVSGELAEEPGVKQPRVEVGVNREVKRLKESKSIALFMGAIAKISKGRASDAEREFVMGSQKALAEGTGSAGGFLVPAEFMPDILGLLRAQAVVRRANPRLVPFNRLMNQTSISSGATAYYTAENARITPSEPTFGEAPILTPKNLTGLVPVSNYLLDDAAGAEGLVRQDLTEVLALREDLAFLQGTGTGGEPTGLRNIAGRTLNPQAPGANGFQPTLAQLRKIRATFRAQNAGAVRPVWFFNPGFLTYLETLVDTTGRFLADSSLLTVNDDQTSGVIDGVPFFTSTQIPANLTQGTSTNASYLLLVNMAETIVGESKSLEIDVSNEASYTPDGGTTWISAFQNGQTLFRAVIRHDITHRRPAQVLVQEGVLV